MKLKKALLALILIQGLAWLGAGTWQGLGGGSLWPGLILSFEFAFWAGLGIILCSFWTYKRIITKNITQNKTKNISQNYQQNHHQNFTHSPTQPCVSAEAGQLANSLGQVAATPYSATAPCPAPSSGATPSPARARPPLILIKAVQNPQKLTNFWEAKDDFVGQDNWRNKLGLGLIFFSGAKLGAYAIFVLGFLFLHARGWLNLAGLLCGILALLLCLLIYAYEPHKNH